MLATTCWVIKHKNTSDLADTKRVYLREEDAEAARETLVISGDLKGQELQLEKRTLVLMFGCTDTYVSPEALLNPENA